MFLVPTFQPPPTSIGRNLSQFQHLDFLLAANQHRQQLRPQLQHQVNTTAQQTAPRNATTAKQGDLEDDCFNLFGGDIVVENVQALNQTKSALTVPHVQKELWSRSSDKGPTSSKFRLLANLLDKDVDNDTGKTTKRKDDGEPVVTKGASVAQQSQKRARQNGQVASATDVVFETTDFVGIERLCRNAGGSLDGLRSFVRKAQSSSVVAITVLFQCLTTNHCTTTVKYCTQSSSCRHWNCICDRHVRSTYVVDNVMGVVVRIPAEPETLYFLPLMNCLDNREAASSPEQGSKRKLLPMQCSSSLSERVGALSEVFAHPGTEKVVFNAQVALIPVLHQIALYAGQSTPSESQKEEAPTRHVNCLQMVANLFDPRIGAYLCDSDISEAQLELESLLDKYPQVKVRGATDVGEASSVATAWGASASASSKQAESGRIPIPNHDLVGLGSVARAVQRIKGELDSLLGLQAILATEMTKMGIARIFHEIEMPMTCLLAAIEHRGVVVDVDFLSSQRSAVAQKINIIESEIFAAIAPAQPFNVASPEQVSHVLFEVLHLPPPAQTSKKGKHHSTSEEDLLRIRQCHPVVNLILSYRALAKISSTYVDGLRPFVCKENAELHQVLHSFPSFAVDTPYPGYPELPENRPVLSFFDSTVATTATSQGAPPDAFAVLMGTARSSAQTALAAQLSAQLEAQLEHRIHAYWQQTVVRTGRLSCTKPNLQNIPNKQNIAGMEVNMRCAFKATQGYLYMRFSNTLTHFILFLFCAILFDHN